MVNFSVKTLNQHNLSLLHNFLAEAGDMEGFRYFESRSPEVVLEHIASILVLVDDRPVAYGHLDPENGIIWLGVAVREDFRGQGWGSYVVRSLLQLARLNGCQKIRLSVDHTNEGANRLYQRIGFKVISVHERFVLMEKEIST